jgi:hypothetical protein
LFGLLNLVAASLRSISHGGRVPLSKRSDTQMLVSRRFRFGGKAEAWL